MYGADVVAIFSVLLHQPKQAKPAEYAYMPRCPLGFSLKEYVNNGLLASLNRLSRYTFKVYLTVYARI